MVELTQAQEERAMMLHKEAIVVDTHCDTLTKFLPKGRRNPGRKLGDRSETGHIDMPRMIDGGVTCQTFARYTGTKPII